MPNPVCPDDPSIVQGFCEVQDVKDPLFLLVNRPPAGSAFRIRMVLWKALFRDLPFGLNLYNYVLLLHASFLNTYLPTSYLQ